MYSLDSTVGEVVSETVPVVGLTWIWRLVGAEQPHFLSSFVIAVLIFGSRLRASDRGVGVGLVE